MIVRVYAIECLITNWTYIGSSDNCAHCITQYQKELIANKYQNSNPTFQDDWNIHGQSNFQSWVIFSDANCIYSDNRKNQEEWFINEIPEALKYNVKYSGTTINNTLQFYTVTYKDVIDNNFFSLSLPGRQ